MARNYKGVVPRGQMVYIVRGETSGHVEGQSPGLTEWQFSDGPSGSRGSSADYTDLMHGLEDHRDCILNIDEADFGPAENDMFCAFVAGRGQLRNKLYVGQAPLHVVTTYREADSYLAGVLHCRKGWHWHFSVTLPYTYEARQVENGHVVHGPFDTEEEALDDAAFHMSGFYCLPEEGKTNVR